MRDDTVREELQSKICAGSAVAVASSERDLNQPRPTPAAPLPSHPHVMLGRGPTQDLAPARTSPTLVGFQNAKRASAMPEWRLQMQNAARQRLGLGGETATVEPSVAARPVVARPQPKPVTAGAILPEGADPRLASALNRINSSRNNYATAIAVPAPPKPAAAQKNFPFNVVSPTPVSRAIPKPPTNETPRPKLVAPVVEKLDTNKLPKLETVLARDAVDPIIPDDIHLTREDLPREIARVEAQDIKRIVIAAAPGIEIADKLEERSSDEIEDLAPLAMRFNAGLFDLIIGIVVSMVALSPFALAGGSWVTFSGAFTFIAMLGIVMFLYLTACIAFVGKTVGMRLFSLEIVDAEANAYPTLHQAAVSSSVYLLSLLFAGAGFLTVFFNEERRAAHDLLSGTIIVREF